MAQLSNLTEDNVGVLRETFESKIASVNPEAKMFVGPAEELIRLAEHAKIAERLCML